MGTLLNLQSGFSACEVCMQKAVILTFYPDFAVFKIKKKNELLACLIVALSPVHFLYHSFHTMHFYSSNNMCAALYESHSLETLDIFHRDPYRPIQFENTPFYPLLNYNTQSGILLTV